MVLLLISCLLGFVAEVHGEGRIAADEPPEQFGEAGVMQFAHGMPMHAIQLLLLLVALGLWLLGVDEACRSRSLVFACVGFYGLTVFAMLQTFSGRARLELKPPSAPMLGLSAALLALPAVTAAAHLLAVRRSGRRRAN
jgi:hypothetical protein